jgi:predicted cupin superfamily sugar epimerase
LVVLPQGKFGRFTAREIWSFYRKGNLVVLPQGNLVVLPQGKFGRFTAREIWSFYRKGNLVVLPQGKFGPGNFNCKKS